jgi:Zinc carboxypeptidase
MQYGKNIRTLRRLSIGACVFAFLSSARAQNVECEFDCDLNGECAELVPADVTLCSQAHVAILQHAIRTCLLQVVGDSMHLKVNDKVTVFAPTLKDIPGCPRSVAIRSNFKTSNGGVVQIAPRVGDLDLAEQQQKYSDDASFYNVYHVLDDMQQRWAAMARKSTDVRLEVIGQSFQGRDIQMLRIGRTSASAPRRIFINGAQHAREWAAAMTVTYIADQLTSSLLGQSGIEKESTSAMSQVRDILRNVEVLVVPISNPDGYIYTQKSRFHRKNMRTNNGSSCTGVDLNRNWGKNYNGGGSVSSSPCDDVFVGAGAFSEPETAALRGVVLSNAGIIAHIDYHSYGGMILGPWSYSGTENPPNGDAWRKFSTFIEEGMGSVRGTRYRAGLGMDSVLPYFASGVMADWTYANGIMSATIEVHPVVEKDVNLGLSGFILDVSGMRECSQDNFGGFIGLLKYAEQVQTKENTTGSGTKDNLTYNSTVGPDREESGSVSGVRGKPKGLSKGAYIGIAIGASAMLLFVVVVTIAVLRGNPETAHNVQR